MSTTPGRRPVVVGIDDRLTSSIALDWAVDEASRRHLPLHILQACHSPSGPQLEPDEDTAGGAAPAVLADAVMRAKALAPHLQVTIESATARTYVALIDASKKAACIVVGAHGRGASSARFSERHRLTSLRTPTAR